VVVVGSANMDLVATTPVLPRPGETVLGTGFNTLPGGKGANQAVAAARAGADCVFIGAVGEDAFAGTLRANLVGAGVDVQRLRGVPGASGVALIAVDGVGENLIVVAPGANAALEELTEADQAAIRHADVLLCQLEIPISVVAQAAAVARESGTVMVLNAAPAQRLPADLLDAVDLLIVNQLEAETVLGREGRPDEVLAGLVERVSRVVMTLGESGAAYADRDGTMIEVRAPRVTAVDTTAAGDAFTGALAVAWAERRPMAEALGWACAAGAASVRKAGASAALPTRDEIDGLYRGADASYRGG
jgi:ribokinase